MTRTVQHLCLFAVACLVPATRAQAAEWGNLSGRFVVEGDVDEPLKLRVHAGPCAAVGMVDESLKVAVDRSLANFVIYLRTKDVPVAPRYSARAPSSVALAFKNCQLEPHVVVLRTPQALDFENRDPIGVNLILQTLRNPPLNVVLAGGESASRTLDAEESLPLRLDSTVQPWLRAWVVLRDSPYAAVSGPDGRFTILELPVGDELEFQLWHERPGFLKGVECDATTADAKGRIKIRIRPGDNDLGDITVPAAVLK